MPSELGRTYYVGGVNGVGKSSLLQELEKRHDNFSVLKGSAQFMEWLGLAAGDYDALRALPSQHKAAELERMMRTTLATRPAENHTRIVDAHYLHYKGGELLDVTGDWMQLLDALFVVQAAPEMIEMRVWGDNQAMGRQRDLFPHGTTREEAKVILQTYLDATLIKAQEVAARHGTPLFIIDNSAHGLDAALEQFFRYHSSL